MSLDKFTLLCVEDESDTLELLEEILRPKVKKLYLATNGQDGLEIYKKVNPDIVLTDIQMPIMNGIEMSKEIKSINPHQPIAVFTAFTEPKYLKQLVNIGIDKYMQKPISNINIFLNTLESIANVLQLIVENQEMEIMLQSQSRLVSLSEMLGNIAHQWRQPLSMINAKINNLQVKIALEQQLNNEDINDCISKVSNKTENLSQMITDFRTFFIDGKDIKNNFNIKATIEKLIEMVEASYESEKIDVITNLIDCHIFQNESQLIQVLLNIFNNSKDAHILNNTQGKRYFFIDMIIKNNNLIISFKDNAGGIKEDIIDKVFDPYFTTKHQSEGTGISLYMTHQIITRFFKGTIDAFNKKFEYGEYNLIGAEFSISFPIVLE